MGIGEELAYFSGDGPFRVLRQLKLVPNFADSERANVHIVEHGPEELVDRVREAGFNLHVVVGS